jgi:hypothetical protein
LASRSATIRETAWRPAQTIENQPLAEGPKGLTVVRLFVLEVSLRVRVSGARQHVWLKAADIRDADPRARHRVGDERGADVAHLSDIPGPGVLKEGADPMAEQAGGDAITVDRNRQEIDKSAVQRIGRVANLLSGLVELMGIEPMTS